MERRTRGLESARADAEDTDGVFGARMQARYDRAHFGLFGGSNDGAIELDMVLLNRGRLFCMFPSDLDVARRDFFES